MEYIQPGLCKEKAFLSLLTFRISLEQMEPNLWDISKCLYRTVWKKLQGSLITWVVQSLVPLEGARGSTQSLSCYFFRSQILEKLHYLFKRPEAVVQKGIFDPTLTLNSIFISSRSTSFLLGVLYSWDSKHVRGAQYMPVTELVS